MKSATKKEFREYLNAKYADQKWSNGKRIGQRVRGYGDYLYSQDKVMFDLAYERFLNTGNDEQ